MFRQSFLATLALCLVLPTALAWPQHNHQCSPSVISLATGIHININAQYSELNQTETLLQIESASQVDKTAFLIGKGELLADIAGGIKIRIFNLEVAPKNNAAIPGLEKYAAAQLVEQSLAESLNGEPSHDIPILETIKSDVMAGIQLNMNNEAAAIEGCSLGLQFPPYETD